MTVLVLLLAAGVAGGLLLVATALVPAWRPDPRNAVRWRRRRRRPSSVTERRRQDWQRGRRAVLAVGSGLLILLYLRIPATALLVATLAWLTPTLLGGAAEAEASIARLEALADWTRRVADLMSSGAGLEQAMEASLSSCPPPITTEVGALVARLTARWTAADALRAFADDLVDADEVVGALILAADVARGAGLRQALIALAEATEARVRARREVEADRAKPRSGARTVMIIIGVSLAAVMLLGRQFLIPYRSLMGEIVLVVDGALFLAALWWMRTLSRTPPEPRLLPPSTGPAAAQRVGDQAVGNPVASAAPPDGRGSPK